jgi:ssDNA-binding replication factor A large subunit
LRIPDEIIKRHFDVEKHEIIYADGGSSLLSELDPEMKGNWRIRVRVVKKSEVRTWVNAKGEG